MKKLYTEEKWKRHTRKRQRHEEERRRRRKLRKKIQGRGLVGVPRQKRAAAAARGRSISIAAPREFSFVGNAEEMIGFITNLKRSTRKNRDIFIDMSDIQSMTPDAIVVLLSEISKIHHVNIRGNVPEDPKLANMLGDSGFHEYVQALRSPRRKSHGSIRRREGKVVDPIMARDVIRFATSSIFGAPRRWKGVYRVLIECMNNTVDHAASVGSKGETWWTTVYCNEGDGAAQFSFVDSGVGIFKSVKVSKLLAVAKLLGFRDNGDVLRSIFRGEIVSRTGLPYRGKGLPSIYEVMTRGGLSRLVVITNDLYADISNDSFITLSEPFGGTFWHWEVQGTSDDKHTA